MLGTLLSKKEVADNVYSFEFSIPEALNHTAGQYVNLTLPHDNIDSRGKERWFSVSSAPAGKSFQITTKYAGDKSSSFKKALMALKPGDPLLVSSPMGDFVMPIDKTREMLFVAAGIGITPFLSMFKFLKEHPEKRKIYFYYALAKKDDGLEISAYQDILQEVKYFIDAEGERISSKIILHRAKSLKEPLIYLAGPERMTESFRDELIAMGVKREDIVGDYFDGY